MISFKNFIKIAAVKGISKLFGHIFRKIADHYNNSIYKTKSYKSKLLWYISKIVGAFLLLTIGVTTKEQLLTNN